MAWPREHAADERSISLNPVAFQLAYYVPNVPNAGDAANGALWPKLMGLEFARSSSNALFGIGSILSPHFDRFERKFVVGAAARGFGNVPGSGGWRFFAVRGPLTAAAFGLDRSLAITDPGVLVPDSLGIARQRPRHRFGLVSYFRTEPALAIALAEHVGALPISTRDPVATVLGQIADCEVVFTESLHGAIFADALRVPWVPVLGTNAALEGPTASFKWQDWCSSMLLDFDPVTLRPMNMGRPRRPTLRLKQLATLYRNRRSLRLLLDRARPSLSAESVLADRKNRLHEAILLARAAMLEVA